MKIYHFPDTLFGELYYCPELRDAIVYKSGSVYAIFSGITNLDFRDMFEYEEIEDDYYKRREEVLKEFVEIRKRLFEEAFNRSPSRN